MDRAPATSQLDLGPLLGGRFQILRPLGHGGMGTVLLAEDTVLDREVAVKSLHADGAAEERRRFRREARLGASLNHPNLVTVFDTIDDDDGLLIVMEYVEGPTLAELIEQGTLWPEKVMGILRPVAEALDHAHARGVVHRDVKPANVLVGDDGVVKLADLGTARSSGASQITTGNLVTGTLAYIAPERLADGSPGSPAADVYSLAAVAFEALSGRKAQTAEIPAELVRRATEEPAPDLREVVPDAPASAAAVLGRGLSANPEQRPPKATLLLEALERVYGTVLPAPVPDPAQDRGPALRLLPLGVGAALAGAVLALAVIGIHGRNPDRNQLRPANAGRARAPDHGAAAPAKTVTETATATSAAPPHPQPSGGVSPGESGPALNDQGYRLIQEGRYAEAVPLLQQAVDAFPDGSTDINYAYALYNLGHALRLAGRPEEAIPILEQRLKIPDQTATVQGELDAARAAAGK